MSTNVPAQVELSDGSRWDLWIKGDFSELGRRSLYSGVAEAAFDHDLLDRTGVRTLRPIVAAVDFETHENVIVTEDELGRGTRFLHGLDPFTPDQAAASLEQLATRHAATWMCPRHSLQHLTGRGIPVSEDAVWPGILMGMVHGFHLWAITLKVDPRKTAVLLERLGTAVDDDGALDGLAKWK